MKKAVFVRQRHKTEGTVLLCYEGLAQVERQEDKLTMRFYDPQTETQTVIRAYASGMLLECTARHQTRLSFRSGHTSSGHVDGPYGRIPLRLYTYRYQYRENTLLLEYGLQSGDEIEDRFILEVEMKEDME